MKLHRGPDPSLLDGFTDVTEGLRGGVYILLRSGTPVFIGRASKDMLAKIVVHRANASCSTPAWFPIKGIRFDQVLVRYVHPDRLTATYEDLLTTLEPVHNATPAQLPITANH